MRDDNRKKKLSRVARIGEPPIQHRMKRVQD
jgi:hypothetical protein